MVYPWELLEDDQPSCVGRLFMITGEDIATGEQATYRATFYYGCCTNTPRWAIAGSLSDHVLRSVNGWEEITQANIIRWITEGYEVTYKRQKVIVLSGDLFILTEQHPIQIEPSDYKELNFYKDPHK